MRKNFHILCLAISLSLVWACVPKNQHGNPLYQISPNFALLYQFDSLRPDSAMFLLQSIKDTLDEDNFKHNFTEAYYEYQLLVAEIYYKNYYQQKNNEEILDALDYYHQNPKTSYQEYMHARAHYFNGIHENENNHPDTAFTEFFKALDILNRIEESFHDQNRLYHIKGLIYNRLGWILYTLGSFDLSLDCFHHANSSFENTHNYTAIALNYELIGDIYYHLSMLNEAGEFFQKAYDLYHSGLTNPIMENRFIKIKSYLYFAKGKQQEAIQTIHQLQSQYMDGVNDNLFANELGVFYYMMQEYDSALYYYQKAEFSYWLDAIEGYSRIIEIAKMKGDLTLADQYSTLLIQLADDTPYNSNMSSRLVSLYENYQASLIEKDLIRKNHRLYILLGVTIVVLVTIYSIWLFARKRKLNRQIIHNQWNAKRIQGKLNHAMTEAKDKEKKIQLLEEELKKITSTDVQRQQGKNVTSYEERLEELKSQPICIKILSRINEANIKTMATYPDLELSENLQSQFIKTIDNVFEGFSTKIFNLYPRLTKGDIIYCCLYIIGLNEKESAALTGKTYQTVWTRSNKLRDIFGYKGDMSLVMKEVLSHWE